MEEVTNSENDLETKTCPFQSNKLYQGTQEDRHLNSGLMNVFHTWTTEIIIVLLIAEAIRLQIDR